MTPTDIRNTLLTAFDLSPVDFPCSEFDYSVTWCWNFPTEHNLLKALEILGHPEFTDDPGDDDVIWTDGTQYLVLINE